jgi:hypothetical protein
VRFRILEGASAGVPAILPQAAPCPPVRVTNGVPNLLDSALYPPPPPFRSTTTVRPMRWGVSRQAKSREFDASGVDFITLLD